MATATLVHAGAHRLRYLITAEGTGAETVAITTVGTATPDTLTDSVGSGVIKQLSKAVAGGYGTFAAGLMTLAQSRALWGSDLSVSDPSSGSPNGSKLPTAKLTLTGRVGGAALWNVGAALSGVAPANPTIAVSVSGQTAGDTAYLDVEAPNTIGA